MILTANLRERVRINSVIRVRRTLSGLGKINVNIAQQVEPSDIIATYQLTAGFVNINLAKILGVSPASGESYLKKKKGERIYKGELLAEKVSIFGSKVATSPTDGVVDDYIKTTGDLRMSYLPKQIKLTSGVYGIVDQLQGNDIFIKTIATEIFGVFGSGKERSGVLTVINGKSFLMGSNQVKADMKSHVVAAGALIYREALQKAIDIGVSGIVTGGLNAKDFVSMTGEIPGISRIEPHSRVGTDIGLAVMATEGFGALPIGDDIYQMIRQHEGKYVFITGNSSRLILPVLNPNIIMTLKNIVLPPTIKEPERQPEIVIKPIRVGSRVRFIWSPFAGSQGEVVAIDKEPTTLPSGVSTYMLTVVTAVKKLKVPYPNVELTVIN